MSSGALAEWSKAVRARDVVCTSCGTDKALVAHHKKPKGEFPELAFDIGNGVTLCANCHTEHHKNHPSKKGGKKSTAKAERREALIRFLQYDNDILKTENLKLKQKCAEYESAYSEMTRLFTRK